MQIQDSDGDEMVDKVRDLSDQVPAQVQFVDFAQLLDALRHRRDLLEAEVQAALAIKGQLHTALSHFQGNCLTFGCLFVFLSLGHPRDRAVTRSVVNRYQQRTVTEELTVEQVCKIRLPNRVRPAETVDKVELYLSAEIKYL